MLSNQKPTGTVYSATIGILIVAFVFSPAALILSRQFGTLAFSLALTSSVICTVLAWTSWKTSQLTIPSIAVTRGKTR